ncbi:hypothetical protein [Pseudomonas sp. PWP3-1b2]|uniref:hypothetical protein n=1 Tax=Pseudomonas TaxID=286 RepID=UPI003CE94DE4
MSIGALASLLPMAGGLAQEGLKAVTEIAKVVGQLAKSQSGGKEGEGDQNKIAHEEMHNKERVNFSGNDSASSNVNINIA